jgi:hypothetical protein
MRCVLFSMFCLALLNATVADVGVLNTVCACASGLWLGFLLFMEGK